MSVPIQSTYRVQLRPSFGFDDAAGLASYLADLGVTHLYASPYLQAAAGSTHGYDVVDPTRVNDELGGPEAHARMCDALSEAGLGQILDIVPNHMAITGRDNVWWWDVLENGPSSVYAVYFDVDWDPPESQLRNTVLLPILGDHYGRVLEAGQLQLAREAGSFVVRYYEHVAPIAPRSLDTLMAGAARRLLAPYGAGELERLADAFSALPPSWATDRDSVRQRHREKEVGRNRLAQLVRDNRDVAAAVDAEVAAINSDPDALDALLNRQNYRLAWWKTAGQQLDYRRFFDISSLAAICVEDELVFADSHSLILEFVARGILDGLRIDHVDGLRDPAGYLRRLAEAAPGTYVVVEKILQPGELLPPDWPVAGTTGYDWANLAGGLLVDANGEQGLVEAYRSFTDDPTEWPDIVRASKRQVIHESLATDVERLAALLGRVCERHRRHRDFTHRDQYDLLVEVLVGFPVYRTYVAEGERTARSAVDEGYIAAAVTAAKEQRADLDDELLAFLKDVLLLRVPGDAEHELAIRFQQVTSPVMAKGFEDTALYRFMPLVSLNEVGGEPVRFGTGVADFHGACAAAHARYPRSMLTSETHDTKRSEDVRARVNLLSEIPDVWAATVARWSGLNERHRSGPWPDRNTEWLMYQTLVGAWPIGIDRLAAYLEKATREAKVHTSWIDPAADYEEAVQMFAAAVLADDHFVADLDAFVTSLQRPGWTNSLALKLLTLTAPGVADVFQGSELWDFSLVDPDNRRRVDFRLRRELLRELASGTADAAAVWAKEDGTGRSKLLAVTRALHLRRAHPDWFGPGPAGAYRPLEATGAAAEHVVAFTRGEGEQAATIVPRLPLGLAARGGWADTTIALPHGRWRDQFGAGASTGTVRLADLLAGFPVALLVKDDGP
jgi:(1->4)-alpha-D-glucan 1-alpha-D-glucosylmutase